MAKWTLYREGTEISSFTYTTIAWMDIPENYVRCHDYTYIVTCDDGNGHTARTEFIVSSCTCTCNNICIWFDDEERPEYCQPSSEEYEYQLLKSGNTSPNICSSNCIGPCSGEIVSYSAECKNDGNIMINGIWQIIKESNGEVVYGPSENIINYQFQMNETSTDIRYKITYENFCKESASTYYTVASSQDCAPCEQYNGVDLKLPSGNLWGEYNLEGCHIGKIGDYYAWGDTLGYSNHDFILQSYKFYTPTYTEDTSGFTKYNSDDDIKILDKVDDAAQKYEANSNLIIPTPYHVEELLNNTYSVQSSDKIIVRTLNTPNTLEIPINSGYIDGTSVKENGIPYFWTSYLSNTTNKNYAVAFYWDANDSAHIKYNNMMPRWDGLQIRPIKEKLIENFSVKITNGESSVTYESIRKIIFTLRKRTTPIGYTGIYNHYSMSDIKLTFDVNISPGAIYNKLKVNTIYGKIYWTIIDIKLKTNRAKMLNATFTQFPTPPTGEGCFDNNTQINITSLDEV